MTRKTKQGQSPGKKALPLLPEEERELFPGGKPEHPDKLMRDAGDFSFFMNRNIYSKRAWYLLRNYWRLGKKFTAIVISMLYVLPLVIYLFFGFLASEAVVPPRETWTPLFVIGVGAFIFWMLMYFLAPTMMQHHQIPIYKQFEADYNDVRHDMLGTGRKKKR